MSPVLLPGDQAISQVSGGSQLSSKDSFLSKAEVKTISEINGISEVDMLSVFILYSLQLEVEFAKICSHSYIIANVSNNGILLLAI